MSKPNVKSIKIFCKDLRFCLSADLSAEALVAKVEALAKAGDVVLSFAF